MSDVMIMSEEQFEAVCRGKPDEFVRAARSLCRKNEDGLLRVDVAALYELRRATAPRGLGDVIHAVAHPIARAIDAVAGTDLKNCKECEKRREDLNERFPI